MSLASINQPNMIPRLVNGTGFYLPDRRKLLDGTIPVYYGPGQAGFTLTVDTEGQIGDLEGYDPSGIYTPPTDWPAANTLLRMPITVRVFYNAGTDPVFSIDADTNFFEASGAAYTVALAELQTLVEARSDLWWGGVNNLILTPNSIETPIPFIDIPPGTEGTEFLGGATVNLYLADGVSQVDVQLIPNGSIPVGDDYGLLLGNGLGCTFQLFDDGVFDLADLYGYEASFRSHYPYFALCQTIFVYDTDCQAQNLVNGAQLDYHNDGDGIGSNINYTTLTTFQNEQSLDAINAFVSRNSDCGCVLGGTIGYKTVTGQQLLDIILASLGPAA
jgi:hypothetical protein